MASQLMKNNVLPTSISRRALKVDARLSFGKPKAQSAAWVCVDCGYLYAEEKKKGAFEDLPNSYACPVCGAGKKRFRQYEGPVSRSNDNKTMANRRDAIREQLEARGESVGEDVSFLLLSAATAAIFLGAVYYFTTVAR